MDNPLVADELSSSKVKRSGSADIEKLDDSGYDIDLGDENDADSSVGCLDRFMSIFGIKPKSESVKVITAHYKFSAEPELNTNCSSNHENSGPQSNSSLMINGFNGNEDANVQKQKLKEKDEVIQELKKQLREAEIKLQTLDGNIPQFNMLLERTNQNSQQIEQMKQHMMEEFSKLSVSQSTPEQTAGSPAKKDVFFFRRRDSLRKDICWRHHVNCLLNEQHFQFVGDRICSDWKRFLRLLDVKQYRIDNIEEDFEKYSAAEKAVQGLISWQRQTPKQASLCKLNETLESMGRLDIIEELKFSYNPSNYELPGNEIFIPSVDHFVGRDDEIKKIQTFCKEWQHIPRLLYINGLPGVGKREVLLKGLGQIDRKYIIQPNFYNREDRLISWSYQEFILCVKKAWNLAHNKQVSNIREELLDVREPRFLILEMAPIHAELIVAHHIWRFIYDITRNTNQSMLKVIVTSCKHPEEILISNVPAYQIPLRGLDETSSIRLLQMLNHRISHSDGKVIYRFFGGNPFLLLKVGANIKTFGNFDDDMMDLIKSISSYSLKLDYVNRLVMRTEWSEKMENVLNLMDENELVVLAKLCAFTGPIPKCLLTYIFGDNETKHEADHLYTYHCMLELVPNGNAYYLAPVYRVFMKIYIKEDKCVYKTADGEKILKSIYQDAQIRVRKCYLALLSSLCRMFFSRNFEKTDDYCFSKLVKEYRKECYSCENDPCTCSNFVIARAIFGEHKTMIVKALEETLIYDENDFMLLSPFSIFVFLKYMSNEHLFKFQDTDEQGCKTCEGGNCMFSCFYHILLKHACEKKPHDLDFLRNGISVLESKESNGPTQTVLFFLYLATAGTQAYAKENLPEIESNLMSAREMYITIGHEISGGVSVKDQVRRFSQVNTNDVYSLPNLVCNGKFDYIDMAADIAFQFQKYEHAKELWQTHLQFAYGELGEEHPFTAKSFFYMGKCLEKMSEDQSLIIGYYEKAAEVYSNLNITNMLAEVSAALKQVKETQSEVEW